MWKGLPTLLPTPSCTQSFWPDWSQTCCFCLCFSWTATPRKQPPHLKYDEEEMSMRSFIGGRRSSSDQIRSHGHTTFHDMIESSGQFNVSRDFTWRSVIWFLLVHVTYWFICSYPWLKRLSWLNLTENFGYITSLFLGDQVLPDSLHVIITDGNKRILNTVSPKGWSFY